MNLPINAPSTETLEQDNAASPQQPSLAPMAADHRQPTAPTPTKRRKSTKATALQGTGEPPTQSSSLRTAVTSAPSGEAADIAPESDDQIANRIAELWSAQSERATTVKHSQTELKQIRKELAANLFFFHQHLAQAGRSGQWSQFLRERNIPRATANRYIKQHESSLATEQVNCLNEAVSEPTAVQVSSMVKKLTPKLVRLLTTEASVRQFVAEIGHALLLNASHL